ncbi:hypothetical protein As57867_006212, partial [Aphanomyces stellatus]
VLEAGGPSLQATGGNEVPDYIRPDPWTIFDIPGEYSTLAFPNGGNVGRYRIDWVASPGPLYLGKVVGGSSSLNGMLYFRTSDGYVQETKWPYDAATVNANFAAIEQSFGSTNQPSTDGQWYLQEAYNITRNALKGQGFAEVDINAQRNAKSKSFGHPPFAIQDGLRDSPAKTFYGPAKGRANFKLQTSAMVSHVVQRNGKASSVVYSFNGQSVTASLTARGCVLFASGAVSTPKVLYQSGVGPRTQLQLLAKMGSRFPGVASDASQWVINDNVGNNLFDTIQVLTTYKHPSMKPFNHGSRPDWAIQQYVNNHAGPMASPDPVFVGYEYDPNGYQFQLTGFCHTFNWGSNDPTEFGIAVYLNNPKGRTRCEFKPDGTYNFNLQNTLYTHGDDVAAINGYGAKVQQYFDASGVAFVNRHNPEGANHYGGSCIPSNDAADGARCADGTFKVLGTTNMFVGDASLMRTGTVNPYGFVMQIGRQAGVNIQKFLGKSPPPPPSTCAAIQEDTDYDGQDIASTKQVSADLCCSDCAANPQCVLYVWFQGTCYLKSQAGAKSTAGGRRAAFVSRGGATCSAIQEDTDYD